MAAIFATLTVLITQISVQPDYTGHASRIVDGDTFYLAGLPTRIRLWGVAASERHVRGGREAKKTLKALTTPGPLACIHVGFDKYGRILARCWTAGTEINKHLIEVGVATEACFFTKGFYGTCDEE